MGLDPLGKGRQREGGGADLIGEGRCAERHAFDREPFGLAVEGLVLAIFIEQQHGEETGTGPAARGRVERRRWLGDLLAIAAGHLLAHGLNDLPPARDHLECLRDILTELGEAGAAAGRASAWRRDHDTFARQMVGEWLARRASARVGRDSLGPRGGFGGFGGDTIFTGVGFEIFELQLHLLEQAGAALGAGAVPVTPERAEDAHRIAMKSALTDDERCQIERKLAESYLAANAEEQYKKQKFTADAFCLYVENMRKAYTHRF
jgi:hypothetical protein